MILRSDIKLPDNSPEEEALREKSPNTELFLVCILLYPDLIGRFTE